MPALHIHRQVRSWVGDRDIPRGALGRLEGVAYQITRTRLVDEPSLPAKPGEIVRSDGDTMLVQCGDQPLLILESTQVQLE